MPGSGAFGFGFKVRGGRPALEPGQRCAGTAVQQLPVGRAPKQAARSTHNPVTANRCAQLWSKNRMQLRRKLGIVQNQAGLDHFHFNGMDLRAEKR